MHLMELQKPKSLPQAEVSVGRGREVGDEVGYVIGTQEEFEKSGSLIL